MAHRVVCAALVRRGRVPLAHRSGRSWYPDVWDLAGTPDVVLTGEDMTLSVWVVRRWEGHVVNAAPDEHDELRWVDADGLSGSALAHPGYAPLLGKWLRAG